MCTRKHDVRERVAGLLANPASRAYAFAKQLRVRASRLLNDRLGDSRLVARPGRCFEHAAET